MTRSTGAGFRFEMWAVDRSTDPYFHTNWTNKQKITVVASDKQAAFSRAATVLGDAGLHRCWTFKVVSITDHHIPAEAPDAE